MVKPKRKQQRLNLVGIFLTIVLVCVTVIVFNYAINNLIKPSSPYNYTCPILPNEELDIDLNSSNAILVRQSDHQVLLGKQSEEKIYPASMTKIMTVILAIEQLPNLEEYITLDESVFSKLWAENASMAGFLPGEDVRAIDLLYCAILPSGAEACSGLAMQIAGSESEFSELMNQKAEELGLHNTHFTNPFGLFDENHYSTVQDIAILFEYALENETFYDIITCQRYSTAKTNMHPDGITVYSTLFKNITEIGMSSQYILGGKTGYTEESGRCLASFALIVGERYILVTAGAPNTETEQTLHIRDAIRVFESIKQ